MKAKGALFVDSIISSITNFLITFLLLQQSGYDSVVGYGLSMTVSLILLSFQRTMILLPYNLNFSGRGREVAIKEVLAGSSILLVFLFLISCFVFVVFDFKFDNASVVFFLLPYLFCHELGRYLFMSTCFVVFSIVFSFVLFVSVIQSLFFYELSMHYLNGVFCLLFFSYLAVIYIYFYIESKNSKDDVEIIWDYLYWFRDVKLVFERNLQTISQLTLVHGVFLLASFFFPSIYAAHLFVSRSIFQPVQIFIKSIEAVDQRNYANENIENDIVYLLLLKYSLIAVVLSLICYFSSLLVLPYFYDENKIPDSLYLIFWLLISVVLASCRPIEMFFLKRKKYYFINAPYLIGGFVTVFGFWFLVLFELYIYASICVFVGWLLVFILQCFGYKKVFRNAA